MTKKTTELTFVINVVGINNEIERHIIVGTDEDMNELGEYIKTYLDDEASGENVNRECKYELESIY